MMKQNQYSTMNIAQMAVSLFAVNEGYLDDIEVNKVRDFEDGLQNHMKSEHAELMDRIASTGDYDDAIAAGLKSALDQFVSSHTW